MYIASALVFSCCTLVCNANASAPSARRSMCFLALVVCDIVVVCCYGCCLRCVSGAACDALRRESDEAILMPRGLYTSCRRYQRLERECTHTHTHTPQQCAQFVFVCVSTNSRFTQTTRACTSASASQQAQQAQRWQPSPLPVIESGCAGHWRRVYVSQRSAQCQTAQAAFGFEPVVGSARPYIPLFVCVCSPQPSTTTTTSRRQQQQQLTAGLPSTATHVSMHVCMRWLNLGNCATRIHRGVRRCEPPPPPPPLSAE